MKCGSVTCEKPATWEVAWPAQSLHACDDCSLRAVRIANAMGFALACLPLEGGGIPRGPELNEETKT